MVTGLSKSGQPIFQKMMKCSGFIPKKNPPAANTAGTPPREPATKSANISNEEQLKQLEQDYEQEMLDRMMDETKKEMEKELKQENNPEITFGLSD